MSDGRGLDINHDPQAPVDVVPVQPAPDARAFPELYRGRVLVDVIHDGDWIPREFMTDRLGRPIAPAKFEAEYVAERDWGARLIAHQLAASLGLGSYARVNVARVLMDFGRFPGSTPRQADFLGRHAINYPFSKLLSHFQKKCLLEDYYDAISDRFEALLAGTLVMLSIHSYDKHNESGTERPPVSLMTRSIGYQTESEMPWGLFDPLYPDILGEFTADRILRDRISLSLEKAKVPVAHNFPYCLPEGSLEVRYQVWTYFRYLRRRYEEACPDTREEPGHAMVWHMLLDTNLRSSNSEALRSYLHMYRRAPDGRHDAFRRAGLAYERITEYFCERREEIVDGFRFSPLRPSAIAVEVRKDVINELDADGVPRHARLDRIQRVADRIADAVAIYLTEDRELHQTPHDELERTRGWYTTPRE